MRHNHEVLPILLVRFTIFLHGDRIRTGWHHRASKDPGCSPWAKIGVARVPCSYPLFQTEEPSGFLEIGVAEGVTVNGRIVGQWYIAGSGHRICKDAFGDILQGHGFGLGNAMQPLFQDLQRLVVAQAVLVVQEAVIQKLFTGHVVGLFSPR